jgi:hypothetical protein
VRPPTAMSAIATTMSTPRCVMAGSPKMSLSLF